MARLSVGAVCDAVEVFTGNSTAGAALAHFHAGYARVLAGGDPRDDGGAAHLWSFLQVRAGLWLTATALTGTATGVYNAGTNLTTITATAALFDPVHVGDTITVADVGDLVIASYTSTTVVVATAGQNFTAKAVSLPHHGIYTLPSGFDGMLDPPVYSRVEGKTSPDFEETSAQTVFEMRRDSGLQGTPRWYALVANHAAIGAAQTHSLIVAPRPDETRLVLYQYRLEAPDLTDANDKYPLGPASMSLLYKAAALADAELATGHVPGPHEAMYQRLMVGAIDGDGAFFTTGEPPRMGSSQ